MLQKLTSVWSGMLFKTRFGKRLGIPIVKTPFVASTHAKPNESCAMPLSHGELKRFAVCDYSHVRTGRCEGERLIFDCLDDHPLGASRLAPGSGSACCRALFRPFRTVDGRGNHAIIHAAVMLTGVSVADLDHC